MKYIITAGGTGGHIYPAIAIINKIKEKDKNAKFLYIGTTDRMEKDIIPSLKIDYVGLKIKGLSKNPFISIKAIFLTISNVKKCKKIIKEFKPDIVIGVGGYVTVPVIYSAHVLGVKTLLHEQNSIPGKANKMLANCVDTICISMESSKKYFEEKGKVVFTGNPRSEEILGGKKANKKDYNLSNNKKLVVITTGSLGSSSVNEKLKEMLPKFKDKDYEVLLITGNSSYDDIRKYNSCKNVMVVPYVDKMNELLKVTDLIVSRAGATTIAEITAMGLPSILIPSPYVANNHQEINARDLEEHDASMVLKEEDFTAEKLLSMIDSIFKSEKTYKEMSLNAKKMGVSDSSTRIYNEIEKLIK